LGEHPVDLEQRGVADRVEDRTRDAGVAQRRRAHPSTFVMPMVQLGGSLAGKLCSLSKSTSSSSSTIPSRLVSRLSNSTGAPLAFWSGHLFMGPPDPGNRCPIHTPS